VRPILQLVSADQFLTRRPGTAASLFETPIRKFVAEIQQMSVLLQQNSAIPEQNNTEFAGKSAAPNVLAAPIFSPTPPMICTGMCAGMAGSDRQRSFCPPPSSAAGSGVVNVDGAAPGRPVAAELLDAPSPLRCPALP
jgi:hypothetical protein